MHEESEGLATKIEPRAERRPSNLLLSGVLVACLLGAGSAAGAGSIDSTVGRADIKQTPTKVFVWGLPSHGLELSLSTDHRSYRVGSPIWLTVAIRNVFSKSTLIITRTGDIREYKMTVRTDSGQPIQPLASARGAFGFNGGEKRANWFIPTDGTYEKRFPLTNYYNLGSGQYVITATTEAQHIPIIVSLSPKVKPLPVSELKSNDLEIRITN